MVVPRRSGARLRFVGEDDDQQPEQEGHRSGPLCLFLPGCQGIAHRCGAFDAGELLTMSSLFLFSSFFSLSISDFVIGALHLVYLKFSG